MHISLKAYSQNKFRIFVAKMFGTVEPFLKDHPIDDKNVVSQDRWLLMTGSVVLKCRSFC